MNTIKLNYSTFVCTHLRDNALKVEDISCNLLELITILMDENEYLDVELKCKCAKKSNMQIAKK